MSMVDWAFERDADGLWRWMHVDARGVTRARRRVTVVGSADELRKDVDERVAQLRARSPRVHADIKDMLRAFGAVGDDQALDMSIDRLVVGSLRRGEQ